MRLLTLAVIALLLIGSALAYFTYLHLAEADIGSLVPEDFRFAVFYSSANDLVELYEGPYQRKYFNPALARIGNRINLPDLNGYDYDAPTCTYVNREKEEVFVIPYVDYDALSDAFDAAKENLNLRAPQRIASNYLSLSIAKAKAKRGRGNALAVDAARYPIALVGHPESANSLRLMLSYLLAFDNVRQIPGIPLLSRQVAHLHNGVAGLVAEECDDLRIGFLRPGEASLAGEVEIAATPSSGGVLARAAGVAKAIELHDVLAGFPRETVILAGAVLDGGGWKRLGLPLELGDAAFAFGIVAKRYRSRPYTLLVAARPRDETRAASLDARVLLDDPAQETPWTTVKDGNAVVRTAKLEAPPDWLATMLRATQVREDPPAVYLSTATEKGIWLAAIGSHAENTVRVALACLRGAGQLSIFAQQRAAGGGEVKASPLRDVRGRVAIGMVMAHGMRSVGSPMPIVDIAGIGQPSVAVIELNVADKARATLRLHR